MDGAMLTSPKPRYPGPRFQKPRMDAPNFGFNFRGPSMPGQGAMSYDGKKLRTKVVIRKTVDYNCDIITHLQNRIWQRDYRDAPAIQPDSLYFPNMVPPASMLEHPMNAACTKHIRTASNKIRCPIFCLCWTPEGRRLITGASSGEFTLWSGLTFSFETILQAHDSSVRGMIWSHNEQWMLTGDHGGFVKYWQMNMNNVKMYQAHKDPIRGLSFSPTDQKYTSCSDDGTVRIWDFMRCHEERIFRGHGSDVKCVDWHPNKGLIISGSRDAQQPLILWDPRLGTKLATIHAHKNTVMEVKWNRNGNWLLTASRDHLIKLFDVRNMKEEVQSFKGHRKEATVVAWHPIHESLFASGGSDGQIMYWLVGHEREVGSINEAHESLIWSLAWHPLGHILASGSNDHNTKFWTRNRPGDGMRDHYNLNTLPTGITDDMIEYDDIHAGASIPGMGMEYMPSSNQVQQAEVEKKEETSIPGLDFSGSDNFFDDKKEDSEPRKKTPYAKPVPRDFMRAWQDGKQPDSISQQLEDSKPKPPSLLDLPLQEPPPSLLQKQKEKEMQEQQQIMEESEEYMQDQGTNDYEDNQQQEFYEEDVPGMSDELTLPGLGGPVVPPKNPEKIFGKPRGPARNMQDKRNDPGFPGMENFHQQQFQNENFSFGNQQGFNQQNFSNDQNEWNNGNMQGRKNSERNFHNQSGFMQQQQGEEEFNNQNNFGKQRAFSNVNQRGRGFGKSGFNDSNQHANQGNRAFGRQNFNDSAQDQEEQFNNEQDFQNQGYIQRGNKHQRGGSNRFGDNGQNFGNRRGRDQRKQSSSVNQEFEGQERNQRSRFDRKRYDSKERNEKMGPNSNQQGFNTPNQQGFNQQGLNTNIQQQKGFSNDSPRQGGNQAAESGKDDYELKLRLFRAGAPDNDLSGWGGGGNPKVRKTGMNENTGNWLGDGGIRGGGNKPPSLLDMDVKSSQKRGFGDSDMGGDDGGRSSRGGRGRGGGRGGRGGRGGHGGRGGRGANRR